MLRFLVCSFLISAALSGAFAQVHEGMTLVRPALVSETGGIVPGQPFTVGLHLKMAPHWHTYWQYPGDSGIPTTIEWKLPPGFKAGGIQWPLPARIEEEGDLQTYAYQDEVLLFVEIVPPKELREREITLHATAKWLVCEKICVPGEAELSLALPVGETNTSANEDLFRKFRAQLPAPGKDNPFLTKWWREGDSLMLWIAAPSNAEFFPLPPSNAVIGHPTLIRSSPDEQYFRIPLELAPENLARINGVLALPWNDDGSPKRKSWLLGESDNASSTAINSQPSTLNFLLFGFIGGFILNLMPCVLPVIALKIFGFIHQAGETPGRIWRLGLAFVAGIFAWFFGMAALVSALRMAGHELNWSFQFQHPAFLAGMMLVVLAFALNLLGLFEIVLPGKANTTLVEISAHEGYGGAFLHGVFATLMATPCTAPFLGPALGFAFAQSPTVIFAMFGSIAAGMSFPYLVLSARPEWIRFLPKPGMWMVRVKQAMGVLLLGTFLWLAWVFWKQQSARPQPFTPQLEHALAQHRTVFVDFTADWCVNCKVNEKLVLDTEPIQRTFREKDITFLKADWTRGDADITKLLRSFGRAGVPVYVIYPKERPDQPMVLPELLTQKIVLDALQEAQP